MYSMASLFSRTYSHRLYIFLSGLAIFIGGLIYILLRPSEHLFFGWISMAGLEQWMSPARSVSPALGQLFPEWLVFSLPNGLWSFAYALLITRIWSGSRSWLKYFWMATIPVMVLGFEILQQSGTIPGTFSLSDLAFGISGMVLGVFSGSLKTKTKTNNNDKTIH